MMWIQMLVGLVILILLVVGFISFRKDRFKGGSSTMGNALHEINAVFDPSVKNLMEEIQREDIQEDESGEPLK